MSMGAVRMRSTGLLLLALGAVCALLLAVPGETVTTNYWVICRGMWYSGVVILGMRGAPCRATGKIPCARSPRTSTRS
jgi:hypothetical protein